MANTAWQVIVHIKLNVMGAYFPMVNLFNRYACMVVGP
jgi:hypothetical protein